MEEKEHKGASEMTVDMIVSSALKGVKTDLVNEEGSQGQREIFNLLAPTLAATAREVAITALQGRDVGVGDDAKIERVSNFLKGAIRRLMDDTIRAVDDLRERIRMGTGQALDGTL